VRALGTFGNPRVQCNSFPQPTSFPASPLGHQSRMLAAGDSADPDHAQVVSMVSEVGFDAEISGVMVVALPSRVAVCPDSAPVHFCAYSRKRHGVRHAEHRAFTLLDLRPRCP